jgi:excisionase family DNA binding protein
MSAEQHDVMTAAEVAEYLQIPVRSVHDYAARDELPSVRIGRHRRFSRAAVEAVMDVSRRPQRTLVCVKGCPLGFAALVGSAHRVSGQAGARCGRRGLNPQGHYAHRLLSHATGAQVP